MIKSKLSYEDQVSEATSEMTEDTIRKLAKAHLDVMNVQKGLLN